MSSKRNNYPFLSDEDWERHKNDSQKLDKVSEVRKDDLQDKLKNFSLTEISTSQEAKDDLRIVVIGKTGQGKSATANTILGKPAFVDDFTATSVTRESICITEQVGHRKISVMDTPGLQDTNQTNENILKEIARFTKLFSEGVHAFVYVMNLANPRFTAEDKNVLDLIQKTFGGCFKSYCLLVYSHGDARLKNTDLDTYRKKQMDQGEAIRDRPSKAMGNKDGMTEAEHYQTGLAKFLDELTWRVVAIENDTTIPFERNHNREVILTMIDKMRGLNRPEVYTNYLFEEAQKKKEELRVKGLKKGWDPSIMNKVETIIAAHPQITLDKLQAEVRRQLENECREKILVLRKKEKELDTRRRCEEKRMEEQKRQDAERQQELETRRRHAVEEKERKEILGREEKERQPRREKEERESKQRQEKHEAELQKEEFARQTKFAQLEEKWRQQQNEKERERLRLEAEARDGLERQQRREREDIEIEGRRAREEEAERERERRSEELLRLRRDIENNQRLQRDRRLDDQVSEIEKEHGNLLATVICIVISAAKIVLGWIISKMV